jgi:hypothetical protein
MRTAWIGAGTAAVFVTAAALHLSAAIPQAQPCAPGPRRTEAIRLARAINTAQSRAYSSTRAYQPLDALLGISLPDGFVVQVVANATGYIFTVKDGQDGCGFGLFSDQNGVIYLGETLK